MATAAREVVAAAPRVEFPAGVPASAAVKSPPFVFLSSLSATDWASGLVAGSWTDEGLPFHGDSPYAYETRTVYGKIGAALEAAGSAFDQSLQVNQWVSSYNAAGPTASGGAAPSGWRPDVGAGRTDAGAGRDSKYRDQRALFFEKYRGILTPYLATRNEFLSVDRPGSTMMPVDRLLCSDTHFEVELVALQNDSGIAKQVIEHPVTTPLGGYALAIAAGPWLLTAGVTAVRMRGGSSDALAGGAHDARGEESWGGPAPGVFVPDWVWYGNQVGNEVAEVLSQLKLTVEAADADWEDVVKARLYCTPNAIANLPAIEQVWREFWPQNPPARGIIPVTAIGAAFANIEIDLVVARRNHGNTVERISAGKFLPQLGHAAPAIKAGNLLFLSTQQGRTERGAAEANVQQRAHFPHLHRAIRDEIALIQENIQALCEAAGTSIERTVKADLVFDDFADLDGGLDAWRGAFTSGYPASAFVECPPGVNEIPGCGVTADVTVHCD